jgi:hypothetical protein
MGFLGGFMVVTCLLQLYEVIPCMFDNFVYIYALHIIIFINEIHLHPGRCDRSCPRRCEIVPFVFDTGVVELVFRRVTIA